MKKSIFSRVYCEMKKQPDVGLHRRVASSPDFCLDHGGHDFFCLGHAGELLGLRIFGWVTESCQFSGYLFGSW